MEERKAEIVIKGVRENNLKNVNLTIPKPYCIVIL